MGFYYSQEEIERIIQEFKEISEDSPEQANSFFERYGKGNDISKPEFPMERLGSYRELLLYLMKSDREKYQRIHKGVPFYYLAWLSFDIGKIDSGLFFIDACLSEDKRKNPTGWINEPAAKFLLLESNNQVARRTIEDIKRDLETKLTLFNNISNLPALSFDDFINNFAKILLQQDDTRVLISALLSFLIESTNLNFDLEYSQNFSVSSARYIEQLFSGAIIFESIVKIKYPNRTLGAIFSNPTFISKYGLFNFPGEITDFAQVLEGNTLRDYERKTTFETVYKIRNTTAHNLIWDGTLILRNFSELELRVLYAIFYYVKIEYC